MTKGKGRLVLVVGPSGAGKDTLLAQAALQLVDDPRFIFPRRQVTRTPDTTSEDHDSLSREAFEKLHKNGETTLSWEAHGLGYVIPKAVIAQVDAGCIAVCNGSRRILPVARQKYPDCKIILVEADQKTRAHRLAARGRESEAEIAARIDRDAPMDGVGPEPVRIDNSGSLQASVTAMVDALLRLAEVASHDQNG